MRAHAEIIKQWAEDETLEVECRFASAYDWRLVQKPNWDAEIDYRIKPKKKKNVEMWQWAVELLPVLVGNKDMQGKVLASEFYKNTDFLREYYKPEHWKIICRIEGSRIEVEE